MRLLVDRDVDLNVFCMSRNLWAPIITVNRHLGAKSVWRQVTDMTYSETETKVQLLEIVTALLEVGRNPTGSQGQIVYAGCILSSFLVKLGDMAPLSLKQL